MTKTELDKYFLFTLFFNPLPHYLIKCRESWNYVLVMRQNNCYVSSEANQLYFIFVISSKRDSQTPKIAFVYIRKHIYSRIARSGAILDRLPKNLHRPSSGKPIWSDLKSNKFTTTRIFFVGFSRKKSTWVLLLYYVKQK